jgi:hypothetical protein
MVPTIDYYKPTVQETAFGMLQKGWECPQVSSLRVNDATEARPGIIWNRGESTNVFSASSESTSYVISVEDSPDKEQDILDAKAYDLLSKAIVTGMAKAVEEMEESDESFDETEVFALPFRDIMLAYGTRQLVSNTIARDERLADDLKAGLLQIFVYFKQDNGFHLQVYGSKRGIYREITVRDFSDIRF